MDKQDKISLEPGDIIPTEIGGWATDVNSTGDLPVSRSEFPQVVFFAAIDVDDVREMDISLGDALTTYSIEVFAVYDGNWVEASEADRKSVV